MDRIYCSEALRSFLRFTPVTLSTLLTVRKCLRPMPPEEVTRFLVRSYEIFISLTALTEKEARLNGVNPAQEHFPATITFFRATRGKGANDIREGSAMVVMSETTSAIRVLDGTVRHSGRIACDVDGCCLSAPSMTTKSFPRPLPSLPLPYRRPRLAFVHHPTTKPRSSCAAKVPLEFMVDISLERHSVDIGRRGLDSIVRARAFLNRELLKDKTVCLRRAWAGEEGKEGDEEEDEEEREELGGDMASGAASTTLLQDMESARELFFVVEKRSRDRAGKKTRTGQGASTSESATGEEAAGSSSSPSSPRSGMEDAKEDNESGGRGGPASGADEDKDYLVPYWALLRVGELTDDPGVVPEPWPLYGVSNAMAAEGKQGTSLAVSRSQLPPPSQVHRPPNVPNSVGYRIVVINVKVSLHHPRGSSVANDKDAVIDAVTRVRKRLRGPRRAVGRERRAVRLWTGESQAWKEAG